jgi:hypothetical protein
MFHIFTTFGALLLFFAFTWHNQPAKPIVAERRRPGKDLSHRQARQHMRRQPHIVPLTTWSAAQVFRLVLSSRLKSK